MITGAGGRGSGIRVQGSGLVRLCTVAGLPALQRRINLTPPQAASSTGVVRWQGPVVRVQKIIKPCLFILEFEQKILLPKS